MHGSLYPNRKHLNIVTWWAGWTSPSISLDSSSYFEDAKFQYISHWVLKHWFPRYIFYIDNLCYCLCDIKISWTLDDMIDCTII